jgi:hypothetical protein
MPLASSPMQKWAVPCTLPWVNSFAAVSSKVLVTIIFSYMSASLSLAMLKPVLLDKCE